MQELEYDPFMPRIDSFSGENRFLSNFYPSEIVYGGRIFPTSEHLYQALKCKNVEDFIAISECSTPGKAKSMGQKISLISDWETVRVNAMRFVVMQKFTTSKTHEELAAKLIGTKEYYLIEGNNWHDNFFGACTCEKCAKQRGSNWLGIILMEVRHSLMKG